MTIHMKILLATHNRHKVREITVILEGAHREYREDYSHAHPEGSDSTPFPFTLLSLKDFGEIPEVVEDGSTFEENATKKAETAARETSIITLADDSGLEVNYLDGAPGILSARFSGVHGDFTENNKKLLGLMEGVPDEERAARFVCAVAIAVPGGETRTVRGVCPGIIAREESGIGGFGYDPIFLIPQLGKTMAELTMGEKNRISHRGRAFRKALRILLEKLKRSHS